MISDRGQNLMVKVGDTANHVVFVLEVEETNVPDKVQPVGSLAHTPS